jgi:putative endonuclease
MGNHNRDVGVWGENLAADYLIKNGYSILERNYRTPRGEIDLVAMHNSEDTCLVFVEVKTRTSNGYGYPEQAVTRIKWLRLEGAIDHYLENHLDYEYDWRIDVIAIQHLSSTSEPELIHFENIVLQNDETY